MKTIIYVFLFLLPLQCYAPIDAMVLQRKNTRNIIQKSKTDYEQFLFALGESECSFKAFRNPWKVINVQGAAGRWQLMPCALKDIKFVGTLSNFLNSPQVQRDCIYKLMLKNKIYIKHYIPDYQKYLGKTIHGVKITWSGMLASAHIGGVGGLKKFLTTGYNASDGNETVKSYMSKFANYKIGLIV